MIEYGRLEIREDLRIWSIFAIAFGLLLWIILKEIKDKEIKDNETKDEETGNKIFTSPFSDIEKVAHTLAVFLYYIGAFIIFGEAIVEEIFPNYSALAYYICSTYIFLMISSFLMMFIMLQLASILPHRIRVEIQNPRSRTIFIFVIFSVFFVYSLVERVNTEGLHSLEAIGGVLFGLAIITEILVKLMRDFHRKIPYWGKTAPYVLGFCGSVVWLTYLLIFLHSQFFPGE